MREINEEIFKEVPENVQEEFLNEAREEYLKKKNPKGVPGEISKKNWNID